MIRCTINLLQLLYASGFIFMSATEEQLALLATAHVSHVSYILLLYSVSFLLFLFVSLLLHLYAVNALPTAEPSLTNVEGERRINGHADPGLRDAEEFELEGLISDEEEELSGKTNGRVG